VRIETEIDDDCPPILGDPSRIHQVLMNLCANAAQAIGSAHGRMGVRLAFDPRPDANAPHGWVLLEVSDDGHGIAPDTLARVFDPFFTTKSAGEGTGLGLSIVHGIVSSHGGRVYIESESDSGTVVTVRIPATDRAVESPVAPNGAPVQPLRVLVVDDEAVVADVTHRMLEASGHSVVSHTDPASALEAIRAGTSDFDLLLTDYTMHGMTGLELARAAQDLNRDLPVVVMSGFRLRSVDPGRRFIHLAKPFTSDELTATLRLAVAARR
jgi:CheY-like chemotaxis protein